MGRDPNPDSVEFHRTEARVLAQMPPESPVPHLLSTYDDGRWVGLFLEEVDGHTPHLPWRAAELKRVLRAVESLSSLFTPAPFSAPTFEERHRRMFSLWREMGEARCHGTDALTDVDPWVVEHLDQLTQLEANLPEAASGSTLLHSDVRADNLLVTKRRIFLPTGPPRALGPGGSTCSCSCPALQCKVVRSHGSRSTRAH
ncbi:MAG: aminoglycoside phosphotransferase family protein [Thermoplasmata archaeon]|nr:aminoglycoside phosphotransferase family protein [Thermoplasmata archaeon]